MSTAGVKYSALLKSTVKLGIVAWQTHHNNVLISGYTRSNPYPAHFRSNNSFPARDKFLRLLVRPFMARKNPTLDNFILNFMVFYSNISSLLYRFEILKTAI